MQELMKTGNMPMLFPIDPEQYWREIRQIIREELNKIEKEKSKCKIEKENQNEMLKAI